MTLRLTFAILALLSQTGCVAAIPMAMQLASGANSTAQLCSMAKLPGQTARYAIVFRLAQPRSRKLPRPINRPRARLTAKS